MSSNMNTRQTISALCDRLDILMIGLRKSIQESEDDRAHHLKRCPCGRAMTRSSECAICVMERLRKERK